jgi:folate-dependent phosphoribosylglycinamide formyltransferase PurN
MDQRIKWATFYSQSGKEICDIAEAVGRWPDRIITNRRPEYLRVTDNRLYGREITYLPNKPSLADYQDVLKNTAEDTLITLHGWLRIMPKEICTKHSIYNGHPGLITPQSEGGYGDMLKGKDPQERAFNMRLLYSGSVIHRVDPGVDEGPIQAWKKVFIAGLSLEKVFTILRDASFQLWVDFIKKNLKNE